MKRFTFAGVIATVLTSVAVLYAQDQAPKPAAKEFERLKQLVGEWDTESQMSAGPGQPAIKCKGHEMVRTIGNNWIISELDADTPTGTRMKAVTTIGFDTRKGKYVGTYVDSEFNNLWVYEGTIDERGKILTLTYEGPNMIAGGVGTAKYRDIIECRAPDHRIQSSSILGPDGKWLELLNVHYYRKK